MYRSRREPTSRFRSKGKPLQEVLQWTNKDEMVMHEILNAHMIKCLWPMDKKLLARVCSGKAMNMSVNALLAHLARTPLPSNIYHAGTANSSTASANNLYDIVAMSLPAAHRSLTRVPLACLLLSTRITSTSPACLSLLSAITSRLLEVLACEADRGGLLQLLWAATTLNRQYPGDGMVIMYGALDDSLNSSYSETVKELITYGWAVKETEAKGPLNSSSGGDLMQAVGLIPGDYRLLHASGRLDSSVHERVLEKQDL